MLEKYVPISKVSLTGVYLICVVLNLNIVRDTQSGSGQFCYLEIKEKDEVWSLDKHPNQMKNLINNNSNSPNCRQLPEV